MRVLFTCSRTYVDRDAAWAVLDIIAKEAAAVGDDEMVVVHGACFPKDDAGRPIMASDYIAYCWTRRAGHPLPVRHEPHPALWRKFGKRAGMVRNELMVSKGADLCFACIRDGSAGASHCAELAAASGIRVWVSHFGTAGVESFDNRHLADEDVL